MSELVEYIAQAITENPDAVEVTERTHRNSVNLKLTVDQEDMGRVIGKGGRMANAMRDLLRVAAVKDGVRVSLEIGE